MAVTRRMSEQEYLAFVRSDAAGTWELHAGQVVQKPAPLGSRSQVISGLARQMQPQLDPVE